MKTWQTILTSVSLAVAIVALGIVLYPYLTDGLASLAGPPAPPTKKIPFDEAGAIFIDSPEIYTRERLVNDRYQQDAWLRRRLEQTDSLEFGVQGVREVRAATKFIAQAKLGVAGKSPLGDQTADQPSASLPAEEPPDANQNRSEAAQSGADKQDPKAAPDRSPTDDFRDRVAYREEVRSAIIENQLDDRHDLDGNTLYRLKFDATVIPTVNNHYWGKVEVKVAPKLSRLAISRYSRSWSMEARARHLQKEWFETNTSEAELWLQVFRKYLDGRSQTISSQFAIRIAVLRRIIELEESHKDAAFQTIKDLRELQFRIDRVVSEEIEQLHYASSKDSKSLDSNLKNKCGRPRTQAILASLRDNSIDIDRIKIIYADCLIQGTANLMGRQQYSGRGSKEQMVDQIIAATLWQDFRVANSKTRHRTASRNSYQSAEIEDLRLSDDRQSLVRAAPIETWETLFDVFDLTDEELSQYNFPKDLEYDYLICREDHPEVFQRIEEELQQATLGVDQSSLVNSPIFRLESPSIVTDPDSGLLRCFEDSLFLVRSDGFIAFLERFMDDYAQPAFSYAITPKESVQRLSDNFHRAQATSVLAAVSIAASALDAQASASALKDLQSNFSGIGRYPLVVGYSNPEPPSDPQTLSRELVFGWIMAPRFHPGRNGGPPAFRQVLTQRALSALVSVPAWWPALNLEISTSWMDMESGVSSKVQHQQYPDVRLPGDLHEIQRILFPVLDKAPKIDRNNMDETVFSHGQTSGGSKTSDNQGIDSKTSDNQGVSVLIPGRNLWRSTVVTLGAERAREIWVMPNMGGIVARFDRIPALHSCKADHVKLRVWTSEGMDIVHNKVFIVPQEDASGESCWRRIVAMGGPEALPPTVVANADEPADRQQVAAKTDDPDTKEAVEATLSGSPATPGTGQSDRTQAITSGMGSAEIVAENLVKTLDQQVEDVAGSLDALSQGDSRDLAAINQSIVDLRQTAQKLAALDQSNQAVLQLLESATSMTQVLQVLQGAIDDEGTTEQSIAGEELERQASNLAAQLQVFDLESRRTELDRAVTKVFLDADSDVGAAAIQQNGHVPFKLQISGLSELTGQNLELRVGLIPKSEDEFVSLEFLAPIEAWESDVVEDMLQIETEVPFSDSTTNGSLVAVALQVAEPTLGYASELVRSEPLVFYVDEERASIRAVGADIRLDPELLEGIFSLTLPAWMFEAFPAGYDNEIIAKASLTKGDEKIELEPYFYSLNDFDEDDTRRSQELTLSMIMDFYDVAELQDLQDHFDSVGYLPVELVFESSPSGDLPEIRSNLVVKGFAEERPMKK